jgi:hypothetical protein
VGTAGVFALEKLVIGVLVSRSDLAGELLRALAGRWGPPDRVSDPVPFTFSDYYQREMGPGLLRYFISFRDLVDPSELAPIKRETNALEDRFRERGQRRVNLDPGIMSLGRFALATTKDSGHRIPLEGGIYAELTLRWERGRFRPLPWTYPDYRSEEHLQVLAGIRELYKRQVREKQREARSAG